MGISDSISSGFSNGGMPGYDALKGGLDRMKERRSDRRKFDYEENVRHRNQMERDSHAFQYNIANTLVGGVVQMEVDNNRHSNDKDLETHKTNEFGRVLNRTSRLASKQNSQISQFSSNGSSFTLSPAPGPTTPAPSNPAPSTPGPTSPGIKRKRSHTATMPPQGLSAQFSSLHTAPQPQQSQPLRPQP